MAYTVPRLQIEQQFVQSPLFADNPLSAFIFGPNFSLFRYATASEKSMTLLGNYDVSLGIALTSYPWLVANPAATVDTSESNAHIKAYVEDAFALYYNGTNGAAGSSAFYVQSSWASGDDLATAISPATGRYNTNLIQATNLKFAPSVSPADGTAWTRSTPFAARDVRVGDWVAVSGNNQSTPAGTITTSGTAVTGVGTTFTDLAAGGLLYNAAGTLIGTIATITTATAIVLVASAAVAVTAGTFLYAATAVTSRDVFAQVLEVQSDPVNGKVNILRTAQRLFDTVNGGSATLISPQSPSIKIALYLRKSAAMPAGFLLSGTSSTQVGVYLATNADAKLTDPLLVDGTGVLKALTIGLPASGSGSAYAPARVYVEYRALRTDNAVTILSTSSLALVEATLGPVSPENPLAEGVYNAVLNASGTAVYYMGVPTNDLAGYNVVLEQARRTNKVYGLVPLTFDRTVQDAVKAHVTAMSLSREAKWRKAWLCQARVTSGILPGYAAASVGVYWKTAAPATDPETGTAIRMFTVSPQSGSLNPAFATNGVRAGDIVRVFSSTSTLVGVATKDYVISAVRGQTELISTTDITNTANQLVQIIRPYSTAEQAVNMAAANGNDRRVNVVFPTQVSTGGVAKSGYFLAAALAGLRAGSLPHQPLTNAEVLGFDDLTESVVTFTTTDLDVLASAGFWVVTQDVVGGTVYVRHQLTSAGYDEVGADPKFSEDSLTTNVDSVSYGLQRGLSPYVGRFNLNPATLALVDAAIVRTLQAHMLESAASTAGPQLLGYNVKKLGISPLFKDKIDCEVTLTLPFPFNGGTVTLVVP